MDGGILGLLGVVRDHRGAAEYDLRRLGVALGDVGQGVSLTEAARLVRELAQDTGTHIGAAVHGWQYPASREALALMDLVDITIAAHSDGKGKRANYPRPWDEVQHGRTRSLLTQAETQAALRHAGHTVPD